MLDWLQFVLAPQVVNGLSIGVAVVLMALGLTIIFGLLGAIGAAAPVFWEYGMREYQRQRVRTLFDPEADPLGAGYHIIQSKIALGSGGFWGKGFLHGTQAQLSFLPEKQTDFAFTMLAMLSSDLRTIGQMGSTVCIGLLLDTLVVRSFIVPCLVRLLGPWFWWPLRPRAGAATSPAAVPVPVG